VRWAALALAALALTGCETTAEKSAKLEKVALQKERENAKARALAHQALSIAHISSKVLVGASTVLHTSEGAAAVVTLRNIAPTALRDVPIQIAVKSASGSTVYANNTPGLGAGLTSAPLVPAHGAFTWIDDQVQASATPASVTARVGEGVRVAGHTPRLSIVGTHLGEASGGDPSLEGTLVNHSSVAQEELVIYAVARKGAAVVAAGRAIVQSATPGSSTRFQLFFVGDPQGARLEVLAPPTTFG
jgi:hypothetical protein